MTLSLRSAALLAHPRSCARRAVRTMKAVEASRRAQMRIAAGELRATGRRHVPASPDPITGRQPVVERQQSATRRLCWVVARSQSLFEGVGLDSLAASPSLTLSVMPEGRRISAGGELSAQFNFAACPGDVIAQLAVHSTRLGPSQTPGGDDGLPEEHTKTRNHDNPKDKSPRVGVENLVVLGGQPVGIVHAKLLGRRQRANLIRH
jgi:hypothetical protein